MLRSGRRGSSGVSTGSAVATTALVLTSVATVATAALVLTTRRILGRSRRINGRLVDRHLESVSETLRGGNVSETLSLERE